MFTVITAGYGGCLFFKEPNEESGAITLMQSYNLTMNANYLDSTANNRFWNYTHSKYDRYRGLTILDYSTYEFSVTFDATVSMYNKIMDWIINHPHDYRQVSFYEKNYPEIQYTFEKAYITGASFSVSNNATLTMDVTFLIVQRDINLDYNPSDKSRTELMDGFYETRYGRMPSDSDKIVGNVLMPYWRFKICHDEYPKAKILSFSWRFSQQGNLKFGCQGFHGENSNLPQEPMKIVFSNAEMAYDMTCLTLGLERINQITGYERLVISYGTGRDSITNTLVCHEARMKSYSPSIGNHSDYSSVSFSGDIYGRIDFSEIPL